MGKVCRRAVRRHVLFDAPLHRCLMKMEVGNIIRWVNDLLHKGENLSLVPRIHVKPHATVHICNSSTKRRGGRWCRPSDVHRPVILGCAAVSKLFLLLFKVGGGIVLDWHTCLVSHASVYSQMGIHIHTGRPNKTKPETARKTKI